MSFTNFQVPLDRITPFEELNFEKTSPKFYKQTIVKSAIFILILLSAAVCLHLFVLDNTRTIPILSVYAIVVFISLWTVFYNHYYTKTIGLAIREKDVSFKSGVLVQTILTVPFKKIQQVEISQGIIEKWFDLKSVTIYTSGGDEDLVVTGFSSERAEQLRAFVFEKITK